MSLTVWRIVKAKLIASAFDGDGARRFGGRWNSRGTPLVYTAGSQALATLEMLVHLEAGDLLAYYRLIPVTFDESTFSVLDPSILPTNWKTRPTPRSCREIGDAWVVSGRSVVLGVSSVVIPGEYNFLLNPAHPDFAKLMIGTARPFRFDPRLRR